MCAAIYHGTAQPRHFGAAAPRPYGTAQPYAAAQPASLAAPSGFGSGPANFVGAHGGRPMGVAGYGMPAAAASAGRTTLTSQGQRSPVAMSGRSPLTGAGNAGTALSNAGFGSAAVPLGVTPKPQGTGMMVGARTLGGGSQVRGPTDQLSSTARTIPASQTAADTLSQTTRPSGYTPMVRRSPMLTPPAPAPRACLVKASENAVVAQEQSNGKPELSINKSPRGFSTFPVREALRECNTIQPEPNLIRSSPLPVKKPVVLPERSPVTKQRQPEYRNLERGGTAQTATPAGRPCGPHMDVSLIGRDGMPPVSSVHSLAASPVAEPVALRQQLPAAPALPSSTVVETPLMPRELAAEAHYAPPDVYACAPSLLYSMSNAHPMVTPEEKAFVLQCMQALTDIVQHEGGFSQYVYAEKCKSREELVGKLEDDDPAWIPEELLRRSAETVFRNEARNGVDSLEVRLGAVQSMGMKKVVKLQVNCQELDMQQQMSVCWDWDVRLEQGGCGQADES